MTIQKHIIASILRVRLSKTSTSYVAFLFSRKIAGMSLLLPVCNQKTDDSIPWASLGTYLFPLGSVRTSF